MKNRPWDRFAKRPSIKKTHLFNKNHLLETIYSKTLDEVLDALFRVVNNFILNCFYTETFNFRYFPKNEK